MRRPWILCGLLCLALLAHAPRLAAQASASEPGAASYNFKLAVDEVNLRFHAADAHGAPVNDLRLDELRLLDDGKPPRRILAFQALQDLPLRAGVLIDTSESMQQTVAANRAIAVRFTQRLLRQPADQAFVMDFGYLSKLTQPWTGDPSALLAGVRQVVPGRENPLGGTAMFDAICFNEFGKIDPTASGNFVVLFSDGDDNASHTSLEEVVDVCQHANTAIYVFRAGPSPSLFSSGPRHLADLAAQTGGRVFPGDESEAAIDSDLRSIDADLRNQYRLLYNPAAVKHDGTFHRIQLTMPDRVATLSIRSGYYDRPQ